MKILLIGEYSRVHLSLAEGLRLLGHEVVVASDGDGMKKYPRDIDLTRKSSGLIDTFTSYMDVNKKMNSFKGFDVVQLINPCFTTQSVAANERFYKKLQKNNKKIFLGAFGDDSYWVRACLDKETFTYSEFFVEGKSTELKLNEKLVEKWVGTSRERANISMANSSNGIVACLYEYYESYKKHFTDKLRYLPLPLNVEEVEFDPITEVPEKINFFIGINRERSEYKGTDKMENALRRIIEKYSNEAEMIRVESVPYEEYKRLMAKSHVVLDQLYSHSPAMNALLAMAQGKILVGGGEPHTYDLLGEKENRPIMNVYPTEEGVYETLEYIIKNKEKLPQLSQQGRDFVAKHHGYVKVAKEYLDFWTKM